MISGGGKFDILVVGAGFAGCTVAERCASELNKKVLVVERRNHIGGNSYDFLNGDGILVQKYGPHIFHTSSKKVWDYLCRFTKWNTYSHRVLARVRGMDVPFPINLYTMEMLYGCKFTEEGLREYFEQRKARLARIENARDVVVSQVGEELYDLFFRNYTRKQWGVYPEELDVEVTKRIPVRFNRDDRYFTDNYQGLPEEGFTKMFERMLDHKNIHVALNTDYKEIAAELSFDKLVYTGPIDGFFDFKHGKLPYRSLDFRFETIEVEKHQNAGVVNYPNDFDYTRVTEFKQLYQQRHEKTTICYEYPRAEGDPYYPIPNPRSHEIYQAYKKEAEGLGQVHFIGRLAEYRYMNMDQVVDSGLALCERIAGE